MKDGKAPLEYVVYDMLELDARVHKHGADKYGISNWRMDKITTSTYEAAILRHFVAWARGEDIDPDSGLPHLAHIRACCAVVLDADNHGTLIDDRNRMESIDGDTGTKRRVLPQISLEPESEEGPGGEEQGAEGSGETRRSPQGGREGSPPRQGLGERRLAIHIEHRSGEPQEEPVVPSEPEQ